MQAVARRASATQLISMQVHMQAALESQVNHDSWHMVVHKLVSTSCM